MSNPYANTGAATQAPAQPPSSQPSRSLSRASTVLWTLAVIFAAANMTLSLAGQTLLATAFGATVLACLAALLVRHFRSRRR